MVLRRQRVPKNVAASDCVPCNFPRQNNPAQGAFSFSHYEAAYTGFGSMLYFGLGLAMAFLITLCWSWVLHSNPRTPAHRKPMHMVDATAGPAATMNTAGMYAEPRITMKNAGQIPAGETYMHFFTHWNGPFAEAAPMQPSIQEILWDEEGRMPEVEQEDRGVKHGCSYDGTRYNDGAPGKVEQVSYASCVNTPSGTFIDVPSSTITAERASILTKRADEVKLIYRDPYRNDKEIDSKKRAEHRRLLKKLLANPNSEKCCRPSTRIHPQTGNPYKTNECVWNYYLPDAEYTLNLSENNKGFTVRDIVKFARDGVEYCYRLKA